MGMKCELMDFDNFEKSVLIFFGGAVIFGLCVVAYIMWNYEGM